MTTTTARLTATRLGYVDNLRVLLTVLVLAHHSAVTYGALPLWYWTQPSDSPSGIALMLLVIVNQFYFMGFFFMLSGLFVPGSVDRKGPGVFARDRLVRLGIPLVAFWLVARPVLHLPSWPEHQADGESFLRFWFTVGDVGPLWFVEVLLVLSLAYAAFRALRSRSAAMPGATDAGARFAAEVQPRPVTFRAIAGLVALLTVVSFLWRLVVPAGTYWEFVGLPSPAYLPQYVILFIVGLLAAQRGWLAGLTVRHGWVAMVVALASVGVALGTVALATAPGAGALAQLGASLAENIFAVSTIVALLVLFREKFSGQPAWARFAAQNSFAVYVIHPLVLVGVAILLAPIVAPAGVKFLILLAIAVPLCWLSAHLLRRIPGVSRVL
ncbi:acyltransferase family protein [Promicromonospora panici]|uniref:acyltransferase family protein n=1 Tax=Promicromonospora panici TaxID=2219658 RepID=UPI0013ED6EE7|nr:acyltransferase family protein [Promicromonospora panici]